MAGNEEFFHICESGSGIRQGRRLNPIESSWLEDSQREILQLMMGSGNQKCTEMRMRAIELRVLLVLCWCTSERRNALGSVEHF